ncbi:MAG: VRR-NUC domain-containing protein [Planctomycetaceae bacterium]|nr:VRR-NUC domain-containing protein [Planctomycetaceae bacterium]
MQCNHENVRCLNEYEIIRKYRCESCGGVMMCACEEEFGTRFLAHQLNECRDSDALTRIPVTLGFQPNVCRECRCLPIQPFPVAEIYGRTSKIKRYYWRELLKRELELYGEWALAQGMNPLTSTDEAATLARKQTSEQALKEIKHLHQTAPKYTFSTEPSQADIISDCEVEVVALNATYIIDPAVRHVQVRSDDETVGVEDYVQRHYRKQGYGSISVESVPFHVLFGIYLWLVIQDPADVHAQICGFGDRRGFDNGVAGETIWCRKPNDFGTREYAERRKDAIDRHFAEILTPGQIDWLFEYWLEPSERLRQYLWAHRDADVRTAKALTQILPPEVLLHILRYLVDSYWDRYLGWPDLLVYRDNEFFFVEVKSSSDKLSNDQKRWIHDNHNLLNLPFKLVKLHKSESINAPPEL